jgi:hypothetical protein
MNYYYNVVVVDVKGSTTYKVQAQGIYDAIFQGLYARNSQDVTSVTSITVTRTSN